LNVRGIRIPFLDIDITRYWLGNQRMEVATSLNEISEALMVK
jgi:hypothetical protein